METGQRIKKARREKMLTQSELGEMLGVKKSAVSKWERGETQNIKRSVLKKLSDILDIPPAELIGSMTEETSTLEIELKKEEKILLEYYECMTQEKRIKLLEYAQSLIEEQNKQMIQTMARINRLKGSDE